MSLHTTGMPLAIASESGRPWLSSLLGNTRTSASARVAIACSWRSGPRNSHRTPYSRAASVWKPSPYSDDGTEPTCTTRTAHSTVAAHRAISASAQVNRLFARTSPKRRIVSILAGWLRRGGAVSTGGIGTTRIFSPLGAEGRPDEPGCRLRRHDHVIGAAVAHRSPPPLESVLRPQASRHVATVGRVEIGVLDDHHAPRRTGEDWQAVSEPDVQVAAGPESEELARESRALGRPRRTWGRREGLPGAATAA